MEKDIEKTEAGVIFCSSSIPLMLSLYYLMLHGRNSSMQANDEGGKE